MKTLAVDSSSTTASVAIVENEKIIADFFIDAGLTHSETLAPMIKSVMDSAKVKPDDIDLFAITNGPGSFTGLRIGLSIVKAMALVNNKPCIGVSSLHALAYNCLNTEGLICSCLDARSGGIYNAIFKIEDEKITRLTKDRAISIEDLTLELEDSNIPIQFVGDGAQTCYNSMKKCCCSEKISLALNQDCHIKASNVAFIAKEMYEHGIVDNACSLKLNYIKVSQAERLLRENKVNM